MPSDRYFPATLTYPEGTMTEQIEKIAAKYPDIPAYEFFGRYVSYRDFVKQIETAAKALKAIGIRPHDRVTICMPNTPQSIILFYAVNMAGAVANMIHPLSAEEEIAFYLNTSESKACLTLDTFYPKFEAIQKKIHINTLILTRVSDEMNPLMHAGYYFSKGRKVKPVPKEAKVLWWKDFLKQGEKSLLSPRTPRQSGDVAAILYSGGTTGTTKGILLSNKNFNALAYQTEAAGDCLKAGHRMLSIMPLFHGFGLGVCIHTALTFGATCILVPQFTVESYAKLLKKYRPHYIAGVPTLFEALLRMKGIENLDLSQLEGVFSGGDSLSTELKHKVDRFLQQHGATLQVREGYGTTECVTASCLTPKNFYKEGSIGVPFPDTEYEIFAPCTQDALPAGEIGEICLTGPTVMIGYLNNPKETAATLQKHPDGKIWLHTGDLGYMDQDGFVFFKQRLKRMIISSGYNIYPSQIENIIDSHPAVLMSTVIGVKDDYKMQKVKAFVVLRPEIEETEEIKHSILEHCKKNIAKYAMPYAFEYRKELPKTLVGKVAYTVLEKEEEEKQKGEKHD